MIGFAGDETFLITGASSGIGRAIALLLNRLGGTVIANGRNTGRLSELKAESERPERMVLEPKDLSEDVGKLDRWINNLVSDHGKLRGLVHCAGFRQTIPLKGISLARTEKVFSINVYAAIMLLKGFADERLNRGEGSSVVLVSSQSAISGAKGLVDYSGAKGALMSVVRSSALELAPQGIRVNCVLPGLVMTEMLEADKHLSRGEFLRVADQYPLGIGKPEDVAALVCFLLSSKARWITGSQVVIDGGASAG